jgi:hypothetical protein
VNEDKIIAAILMIATSAREPRDSSAEMGIENWRKAIKDYERILAESKNVERLAVFDVIPIFEASSREVSKRLRGRWDVV